MVGAAQRSGGDAASSQAAWCMPQRGGRAAGCAPCCSAHPRRPAPQTRRRLCRAARPCRGTRCRRRLCAYIARTCETRGVRGAQLCASQHTTRTWAVRRWAAALPSRGTGGGEAMGLPDWWRRIFLHFSAGRFTEGMICVHECSAVHGERRAQRGSARQKRRDRAGCSNLSRSRAARGAAMTSPAPRYGRGEPAASEGGAFRAARRARSRRTRGWLARAHVRPPPLAPRHVRSRCAAPQTGAAWRTSAFEAAVS